MLPTTEPVQKAIIDYYVEALKKKDKSVKAEKQRGRNGGPVHLRIAPTGESMLNGILPCSIEDTNVNISGKYRNLVLTIKKAIPGNAKVGDQCYLVVTADKSGKGTLTTKQLTPHALGLNGKTVAKSAFVKTVHAAIDSNKTLDPSMKSALKKVLQASGTSTGDVGSALVGLESDLSTIEKDFGEISGAYWFMTVHDKKVEAAYWPPEVNAPLVDYYVIKGKKKQGISAKGGGGAAASVGNIADILETKTYSNPKKEAARKAIMAIRDDSIIEGTIKVAKLVRSPGYMWLKKNMFKDKDFTGKDIENALKPYKTHKAMWADLAGFYAANGPGGGQGSADVADAIFKAKSRRLGFVVAPLGYDVIDVLNKNSIMTEVLNDATSTINVLQVYMNIKKDGKGHKLNYEVHGFKSTGFKFHWQNGVRTLGNRITMKMDVKKA